MTARPAKADRSTTASRHGSPGSTAALHARYADLSAAAAAGHRPVSIADLVARTWESVTATDFKVVIEAWLAAANDPELGRAIGPVVERFANISRG